MEHLKISIYTKFTWISVLLRYLKIFLIYQYFQTNLCTEEIGTKTGKGSDRGFLILSLKNPKLKSNFTAETHV